MHKVVSSIVLAFALCLPGCAARPSDQMPAPVGLRLEHGVWLFRHKIRLDVPGRGIVQRFDGLMRLDTMQRRIHVAGIGGFGMQLFDITITPDTIQVSYLHPLLEKMPQAVEHIAYCIRRIWFDSLTFIPQTPNASYEGWTFAASGNMEADLWPTEMLYADKRTPHTVTIRLVQAVQEGMP